MIGGGTLAIIFLASMFGSLIGTLIPRMFEKTQKRSNDSILDEPQSDARSAEDLYLDNDKRFYTNKVVIGDKKKREE